MKRIRSVSRARRTALFAGLVAVTVLLGAAGIALAAAGVNITESANRYHFEPQNISVTVGATVTWTNKSDAPHTVTSDGSGGPLAGSVNPTGTYQATFSAAGDYAYHCNIHDYMKGSVHVAALPPTDAIASPGSVADLTALAGGASLIALAALGLRLRRGKARV